MDLSIVIPVFNEQENLPLLATKIEETMQQASITNWEVWMVDDGSQDQSKQVIQELHGKNTRFKGVFFSKNRGQTAAMNAGFEACRNPFVLTMDADLQNDPGDLPKLMEKMTPGVGVVCGVRVKRRDNLIRRISSKIANGIRNWISQDNITDTGCSLKLFRKECLNQMKLFEGLHRFLPTLCKMEGYKVIEVPVSHHPRIFGESSYGVWNRVFKSFFDLLAIRWMKSRLLTVPNEDHLENTETTEVPQKSMVTP